MYLLLAACCESINYYCITYYKGESDFYNRKMLFNIILIITKIVYFFNACINPPYVQNMHNNQKAILDINLQGTEILIFEKILTNSSNMRISRYLIFIL